MPLVQRDCLFGSKPNALIHPFGHVVVFDLSISKVEAVSIGLEDIFIPRYERAAQRGGIDPGGQRIRVVVSDRWIVLTESASSGAVAVKPGNIAAELHKALAVEVCRLT